MVFLSRNKVVALVRLLCRVKRFVFLDEDEADSGFVLIYFDYSFCLINKICNFVT